MKLNTLTIGALAAVATMAAAVTAEAAPRKDRKSAMDTNAPAALSVRSWLVLGPVSHPFPVLHDEKPGGVSAEDLLAAEVLPRGARWPTAGDSVAWGPGATLAWAESDADEAGIVPLTSPGGAGPASAWLAAYVATDRFRVGDLRLVGTHPRRAWLDGVPVAQGGTGGEAESAEVKGRVELTAGKHLLLVQTILDPAKPSPWSVGAQLSPPAEGPAIDGVTMSLDPVRDLDIADVVDVPRVTSIAMSPDGTMVAALLSRVPAGSDEPETWFEILAVRDGSTVQTWRGSAAPDQLGWAPTGRRLAYATADRGLKDGKKTSTLWLADVDDGTTRPLVERVENLGGFRWSPDGGYLVYAATVKSEPDKRGVKLHLSLLDRQAGWRDRTHLTLVAVASGARRRLTAGSLSTSAASFSPDGGRLLFIREAEDLSRRPYSRKEIWEIDLATFAGRKLRDGLYVQGVQYAPDGRKILVHSGPSEFGDAGRAVPAGVVPNESDGQLYVWDPATDAVDAITRAFDPSVEAAFWSRHDGRIYLKATERDRVTLWRWTPGAGGGFTRLDTGVDAVDEAAFAESAPLAALTGSSPWEPDVLRIVDLANGTSRTIASPAAAALERVRRGTVRPFSFTATSGRVIDGRVYLPPAFDERATYPAIVYYYGGTNPVTREWGGRYPKEWWAALGYVVYVLQPTGTTGYGQSASAVHVNDWGEVTSREIIEGTRAFLEAHRFVDPKRVGCIGASYGGFMTMRIVTETDLFAAAVSHAGISQLSSYWGEGYWGYSYGAIATADAFPWNRADIYVDRSPLFRADRAKTPILLTHGASDTNVPVGESDAFYTAMKLLGVPAELLEVEGQDHWILDRGKRVLWSRSIAAWFDRWLKGQPAWWDALHPKAK